MPSHQRYCCICSNHGKKVIDGIKVIMHRFPACDEVRKVWVNRCGAARPDFKFVNRDQTRLCSHHFEGKMGPTDENGRLPTIFPQFQVEEDRSENVHTISMMLSRKDRGFQLDLSEKDKSVLGASIVPTGSGLTGNDNGLPFDDMPLLDVLSQLDDATNDSSTQLDISDKDGAFIVTSLSEDSYRMCPNDMPMNDVSSQSMLNIVDMKQMAEASKKRFDKVPVSSIYMDMHGDNNARSNKVDNVAELPEIQCYEPETGIIKPHSLGLCSTNPTEAYEHCKVSMPFPESTISNIQDSLSLLDLGISIGSTDKAGTKRKRMPNGVLKTDQFREIHPQNNRTKIKNKSDKPKCYGNNSLVSLHPIIHTNPPVGSYITRHYKQQPDGKTRNQMDEICWDYVQKILDNYKDIFDPDAILLNTSSIPIPLSHYIVTKGYKLNQSVMWRLAEQGLRELARSTRVLMDINPNTIAIKKVGRDLQLLITGFHSTEQPHEPIKFKDMPPEYLAPEMAKLWLQEMYGDKSFGITNTDITGKADVYAFAVVLMYMYLKSSPIQAWFTQEATTSQNSDKVQHNIMKKLAIEPDIMQKKIQEMWMCDPEMKELLDCMTKHEYGKRLSAQEALSLIEDRNKKPSRKKHRQSKKISTVTKETMCHQPSSSTHVTKKQMEEAHSLHKNHSVRQVSEWHQIPVSIPRVSETETSSSAAPGTYAISETTQPIEHSIMGRVTKKVNHINLQDGCADQKGNTHTVSLKTNLSKFKPETGQRLQKMLAERQSCNHPCTVAQLESQIKDEGTFKDLASRPGKSVQPQKDVTVEKEPTFPITMPVVTPKNIPNFDFINATKK